MVIQRLVSNYLSPKNAIDRSIRTSGLRSNITPGLVPTNLGGLLPDKGFYRTPDEPADPQDCDRYPSSPFCGGSPFTLFAAPAIIPEIVNTDCDVGIKLNPSVAFIRLPPLSIVYRKPECRGEPPRFVSNPNLDTVEFPPAPCKPHSPCSTVFYPTLIERIEDVYFDPESDYNAGDANLGVAAGQVYTKTTWEFELTKFDFPYWKKHGGIDNSQFGNTLTYLTFTGKVTNITNAKGVELSTAAANYYGYPVPEQNYVKHHTFDVIAPDAYSQVDLFYPEITNYNGQSFGLKYGFLVPNIVGTGEGQDTIGEGAIYQCEYEYAREKLKDKVNSFGAYEIGVDLEHIIGYRSEEHIYRIEVKCADYVKPPPPPDETCMKDCCPCDDTLSKLIIKKLKNLEKVIGTDEFPASLPKSLISRDEGWLGNLIPNGNDEIHNFAKLFEWFIKRFDEVIGQFEIAIEVKDSDPTQPGDQPIGLKLPNIAETLAEIVGLLLQTSINSESLINMSTRNLIEAGQIKTQDFKNYKAIESIVEYLNFKHKDVVEKMPLSFTPGVDNLEDMLKEVETDVLTIELDDKNTLSNSLIELLQAAAITKAVHTRKIDTKGDVKQQIIDTIKGLSALNNKINNNEVDEAGKTDFDRFLEDVEIGFTNHAGITDTERPYGRPLAERPKIKKIGTEGTDT